MTEGSSPESVEATEALMQAETSQHPEHGIKWALVGIGYALLDVAAALREEP